MISSYYKKYDISVLTYLPRCIRNCFCPLEIEETPEKSPKYDPVSTYEIV